LGIILDVCEKRKVGGYATFCTVLTAYAESDFKWNARSENPTSSGYYSDGPFQQTLPWWKNDHFDVAAATNAFLENFRQVHPDRTAEDIVLNCWEVQHWSDKPSFWESKETQNYIRRVPDIDRIIKERKVP
jgi:hypothetical protein